MPVQSLQSLICSIYLTLPMRKVRPVEGKGIPPGVPTGSSPLSPVPLCLPLASLKVATRGRLLPWRLRRGLAGGSRAGNSAEAGKRSGRGGQDPTPARTRPYQPSGEQQGVSKNIYSESKLMKYCISADNGRMWGGALQGRRPTQSAQRLHRGD